MPDTRVQTSGRPVAAFVLSLIAGLWMLSAGGYMGGFGMGGMMGGMGAGGYATHRMYHWNGMTGWMWGQGMHTYGLWWPWFGVAAGILVIIGAIILYLRPEQRRVWGAVILIVSVLDFFLGMGGLFAGAMGVIGGVLAMGA